MSDTAAFDDLVRFFAALPPAARREYEALAEADRLYGEDVQAERRSHTPNPGGPERA